MNETAAPQKQDIDRVLAALKSIDQTLKSLLSIQQKLLPPPVASDRDLDSQYGDPVIKAKDPKDWTGDIQAGKHFSECPAEYLDLLADRLDYFAEKADSSGEKTPDGKPISAYRRLDAARARGWAKRIRAGWVPKTKPEPPTSDWPATDPGFDPPF